MLILNSLLQPHKPFIYFFCFKDLSTHVDSILCYLPVFPSSMYIIKEDTVCRFPERILKVCIDCHRVVSCETGSSFIVKDTLQFIFILTNVYIQSSRMIYVLVQATAKKKIHLPFRINSFNQHLLNVYLRP